MARKEPPSKDELLIENMDEKEIEIRNISKEDLMEFVSQLHYHMMINHELK